MVTTRNMDIKGDGPINHVWPFVLGCVFVPTNLVRPREQSIARAGDKSILLPL